MTSRKAQPSFNFTVTHNKMAKLELVCKQEDVQNIVEIINKNGSTGEIGDGIIYITMVEEIFKVTTGESSRYEL
ncbi:MULTISPECIES: P-II family nitrogen regulator [Antarcticibacterium]|uniref:P-II family nitrogen regulator n=1 Tax=Antarcticibacterium TaxID=2058174 RepID=UPI001FE76CA8|nr:P-II family nitrogen regulator [Antarcticibacterium flavum]